MLLFGKKPLLCEFCQNSKGLLQYSVYENYLKIWFLGMLFFDYFFKNIYRCCFPISDFSSLPIAIMLVKVIVIFSCYALLRVMGYWDPIACLQVPSPLLCSSCEGGFLSMGFQIGQSDEKNTPLRGRDRLRDDPQWSPCFLNYCSWMFPERLRNKSELVGSEEARQVLTRHPRYVTLSC